MELITITEEKMLQLIELYNNASYEYGKSTKELEAVKIKTAENKEPIAPTIDEFNNYQKLFKRLSAELLTYQQSVSEAETITRNAKQELLKNLPGNKWLKVGKYYVGKRTNDWSGADSELLIKKEKPTIELTHQIIN